MDSVLVRYSEIGTKSDRVQRSMLDQLQNRISDRLAYEGIEPNRIRRIPGRIVIEVANTQEIASLVSEIPGVQTTSPTYETPASIPAIKNATNDFQIGESFGVKTNRVGDHSFSSTDVNNEIGAFIQTQTGAAVDLETPEQWIEIDIRDDSAFVFTDRNDGPGGFPVGSQDPVIALISGGIDSPVAAHAAMTRGSDIIPLYFYNKPFAAGDHVGRFEAVLRKLRRFHPGKDWYYYLVDMEPVNTELLEIGAGRMLLHRAVMFGVAAHIVQKSDLSGIVTGESIGQKSSQTMTNLHISSRSVREPIFRPLLTEQKEEIIERAKKLGTFEDAVVNSACKSLAPTPPATHLSQSRFDELAETVDLESLITTAIDQTTRTQLSASITDCS